MLAAIAHAQPAGVLVHCFGGRDRTGQIAMLVLALAGVAPDEIAADYVLSSERLERRYEALGEPDQGPEERFLAERGTDARKLIRSTLVSLDVESTLRRGGLTTPDLGALRERLAG